MLHHLGWQSVSSSSQVFHHEYDEIAKIKYEIGIIIVSSNLINENTFFQKIPLKVCNKFIFILYFAPKMARKTLKHDLIEIKFCKMVDYLRYQRSIRLKFVH